MNYSACFLTGEAEFYQAFVFFLINLEYYLIGICYY